MIEVVVCIKIIKYFVFEFGVFWFMDENFVINEVCFIINLVVICKEVECLYDDFIIEYFCKYNELELFFVWKILEVILMGIFFKFYFNFLNVMVKYVVVREFGLNYYNFLEVG